MGWGISDPAVASALAAIWSVITTIWSWITTLYNIIKPVWGVIGSVWSAIKSVWDYLKPLVSNIYTTYIKPIKDLLTAAWSKIDAVLDWVDKIYTATLGRIEMVYDLLFGRIEDLWERITTGLDKATRLISKVDSDLAAKISKEADRLEAQTIGAIRNVRDELTSKVNDYYHTMRDYVNERYWALKDIIDPYIKASLQVEKHLDISWDAPGVMSRRTINDTITKHAHPFERILSQRTADHADDETYEHLESIGPKTEEEMALEDLNTWDQGPWKDVARGIDDFLNRLDNALPPMDFDMDIALLEAKDRFDIYKQIIDDVRTGRMSWMPTWLVWTMEKLGYISSAIKKSWDDWNEEYNKGITGE